MYHIGMELILLLTVFDFAFYFEIKYSVDIFHIFLFTILDYMITFVNSNKQ